MECTICDESYSPNSGIVCKSCGFRYCINCHNNMEKTGRTMQCPHCRAQKRSVVIGVSAEKAAIDLEHKIHILLLTRRLKRFNDNDEYIHQSLIASTVNQSRDRAVLSCKCHNGFIVVGDHIYDHHWLCFGCSKTKCDNEFTEFANKDTDAYDDILCDSCCENN